jgi:hypothetical protein
MLFASGEITAALMFQRPKAASIPCPSQYWIKIKKKNLNHNLAQNLYLGSSCMGILEYVVAAARLAWLAPLFNISGGWRLWKLAWICRLARRGAAGWDVYAQVVLLVLTAH